MVCYHRQCKRGHWLVILPQQLNLVVHKVPSARKNVLRGAQKIVLSSCQCFNSNAVPTFNWHPVQIGHVLVAEETHSQKDTKT